MYSVCETGGNLIRHDIEGMSDESKRTRINLFFSYDTIIKGIPLGNGELRSREEHINGKIVMFHSSVQFIRVNFIHICSLLSLDLFVFTAIIRNPNNFIKKIQEVF